MLIPTEPIPVTKKSGEPLVVASTSIKLDVCEAAPAIYKPLFPAASVSTCILACGENVPTPKSVRVALVLPPQAPPELEADMAT